jgi:uncharacterized protein YkwD
MLRTTTVVAVVGALVVAGSASARSFESRSHQRGAASSIVKRVPTLEEQVLAAINEARRQIGLAPLRSNPVLAAAARGHSLSMAERGYFQHASATGSPFWYRLQSKYGHPGRYWSVGENLAWAAPNISAEQVLDLWMKSPPHRKNMLSRSWRDIGVGGVFVQPAPGVFGGTSATIVTVDFGVRK